jgi:N-acetylneuraminate synthase
VRDVRTAWSALGEVHYGPSEAERESLRFRRGLYFVRDLTAGEMIDETAVRSLRPAAELEPDAIGDVVGRRAARAVRRGEPVTRDHLT